MNPRKNLACLWFAARFISDCIYKGEEVVADEMVRQHHQLNGHECEQTPGDTRDSLVAQMVKRLLAMWETWVRSLGWEDPLEKEMATHSSTLA